MTKLVFKNLDKVALNIQERCKILKNLFDKKDPLNPNYKKYEIGKNVYILFQVPTDPCRSYPSSVSSFQTKLNQIKVRHITQLQELKDRHIRLFHTATGAGTQCCGSISFDKNPDPGSQIRIQDLKSGSRTLNPDPGP